MQSVLSTIRSAFYTDTSYSDSEADPDVGPVTVALRMLSDDSSKAEQTYVPDWRIARDSGDIDYHWDKFLDLQAVLRGIERSYQQAEARSDLLTPWAGSAPSTGDPSWRDERDILAKQLTTGDTKRRLSAIAEQIKNAGSSANNIRLVDTRNAMYCRECKHFMPLKYHDHCLESVYNCLKRRDPCSFEDGTLGA